VSRRRLAPLIGACLLLASGRGVAAQESQLASDLRREREHLAENCTPSLKGAGLCTYSLITESPLHVALGSLAPQNGFAFGVAFTEHWTPNESWRLSWGADAVSTIGGSWRAGASMKMIHTPATSGVVVAAPASPGGSAAGIAVIRPREFTVIDVAYQTISLEQIGFYGLGPDSLETDRTVFGEQQSLLGASIIVPLGQYRGLTGLRPSLLGGISGRWVDIRQGQPKDGPSIETRFDDLAAPGLARQDAFLELREGVRLKPALAGGRLQLNYLLQAQQFRTSDASAGSFHRWTIDLRHEIPLYRTVSSTGPRDFNGPNDCGTSAATPRCPPVQLSRNRTGTASVRLLRESAAAGDGRQVPFYLQRTLGGSDLNGQRLLAGFDDYRFRGPRLLLLQEGLEHSLWGPVGVFAQIEHGQVALDHGDLGFGNLKTTTALGITIRAGGAPAIVLAFAWGAEGHHLIASMDASLLGGGARPSLC
jgi:hypothetical protein